MPPCGVIFRVVLRAYVLFECVNRVRVPFQLFVLGTLQHSNTGTREGIVKEEKENITCTCALPRMLRMLVASLRVLHACVLIKLLITVLVS